MERIHLVGPNDVGRLCTSGPQIVLHEYFDEPLYVNHFLSYGKKGTVGIRVWAASGEQEILWAADTVKAMHVWLYGAAVQQKKLVEALSKSLNVVVVIEQGSFEEMADRYAAAATWPVLGIGIPCKHTSWGNGLGRFEFIRRMVLNKRWNLRAKHYLWELENPAELAVYNRFGSAVRGSIIGFVSARCYLDSRDGILYSGEVGRLCAPPEIENLEIGYTRSQQFALFRLNDETIQSYCHGALGDELSAELIDRAGV